MTECRHGLSEDCPACMQATIDDLRAQLASTAQARPEPAAMTERLIQAAVDYERAGGRHAAGARRELSDARAAIEAALALTSTERQRCAECDCGDGVCTWIASSVISTDGVT